MHLAEISQAVEFHAQQEVPTMSELIGEVIEHEIEEIVEEEVSGKGLSTTSKVFLAVIGVLFGIWWLR